MNYRIVAISKPGGALNSHAAITHYGWIPEGKTQAVAVERQVAVNLLRGHANGAYVENIATGQRTYCYVRSNGHVEFLQTYSNNQWADNLLSLPTF